MAYAVDEYADLVTATLRDLEKGPWQDIVTDLQRFIAMPMVLKKEKIQFGSGYGHQFNARFYTNDAARNVKLAEIDAPTSADTQETGSVDWRHSETHWSIEERLIAMNRAPARLVNLLETSRVDAMTSLAELLEQNFWTSPSSSSDKVTPYGLPYWVVKATGTPSFQGGAPSGHTEVGGLNPTTLTRWKNWAGEYTVVSKQDLIKLVREAMYKTDFRPPVDYPGNKKQRWALYTVYDVVAEMETLAESQNDNLGNDLASKDGMVTIRRTNVEPVPYLDQNDNTDKPIYGVDWNTFHAACLSGEYMKTTKVKPHPNQHRTLVVYTDITYNFFTNNRRKHFVLKKAA